MTFKVGDSYRSGPEVARSHAPEQTQSPGESHRADVSPGNYAHDNTPARQRELETHGQNQRAKLEGQHGHQGDDWDNQNARRSSLEIGRGENGATRNSRSNQKDEPTNPDGRGRFQNFQRDADRNSNVHGNHHEAQSKVDSDGRADLPGNHYGRQSKVDSDGRADLPGNRYGRQSGGDSQGRTNSQTNRYVQAGEDSPQNSLRNFRGPISTEGRSQSHRYSEFPTQLQRNPNAQSSDSYYRDPKHLLRDTLKMAQNELQTLRFDSSHGRENRNIGLTDKQIERVIDLAARGMENRLSKGERPESIAPRLLTETAEVVRLSEHFSRLERIGGAPVGRAYDAVLRYALSEREVETRSFRVITEVLRDLRSNAFLYPRDLEGPFPLSGRARVVSEMMALTRTLEAIERFAAEIRTNPRGNVYANLPALLLAGVPHEIVGCELADLIAHVLLNTAPTFPGLAGRLEIPRLIAELGGMVIDAEGRPLVVVDGKALRLSDLLFFDAQANASLDLAFDRFSTRLSPVVPFGFDAVYSLIGFDGRALSLPRFMAIQSQINASEFEWLFGKAPLSEAWARSAIEFLKDSISFHHNVLGELLEEAITTGRFHLAVMRGTVEDGKSVPGSFSFTSVGGL